MPGAETPKRPSWRTGNVVNSPWTCTSCAKGGTQNAPVRSQSKSRQNLETSEECVCVCVCVLPWHPVMHQLSGLTQMSPGVSRGKGAGKRRMVSVCSREVHVLVLILGASLHPEIGWFEQHGLHSTTTASLCPTLARILPCSSSKHNHTNNTGRGRVVTSVQVCVSVGCVS